ncbi:MAG: hypothetical protein JXR48_09555 [Candidatus Delongbacteria bacterium]|nr:hypothetical protein [Candidatus Delongbacteria bacterium]MBN2835198.1 hypothetical protein [Candidatus Delongbacteria bacterium]
MSEIRRKIASGIYIDTEYLEKYEKLKSQYDAIKTLIDNGTFDGPVLETQKAILTSMEVDLDNVRNTVHTELERENNDEENINLILSYMNKFNGIDSLCNSYNEFIAAEVIKREVGKIDQNSKLKNQILELIENSIFEWKKGLEDLVFFIKKRIEIEKFDADEEPEVENQEIEVYEEEEIDYQIQKSDLSLIEVKKILFDFIKSKELIFNKIIFDGKKPTISIVDRIISVYYKHGYGYIVNFVSEPDTNFGKFYRNLLKVFDIIKEELYKEHGIVFVPEDGKNLIYLNSFYQNYMFVKEKFDTIMTKYKLQISRLNDSFRVEYLIFDKSTNKYLVFYEGSEALIQGAANYLQNQSRLGQNSYELEFIPNPASLSSFISERYEEMINRVDLISDNNYMKIINSSGENLYDSVYIDMSGVKILIDPVRIDESFFTENGAPDVLILTNSRQQYIYDIPELMIKFDQLKLFTSDITFKLMSVFWRREIGGQSVIIGNDDMPTFSKKDLDSFTDRIIKITPLGKGYNFKNLVNIKFFNSGLVPGGAAVELRDASKKVLVVGDCSLNSSGLMKKCDFSINDYEYLVVKGNQSISLNTHRIDVEAIKKSISENKQVFIFCDFVGNLQHVIQDLYYSDVNGTIVSGTSTFESINKEISKIVNFGSSWGDHFENKPSFFSSINIMDSFIDEYEFYKKFSSEDPYIFILPYTQDGIEMVVKDKMFKGYSVWVSSDQIDKFRQTIMLSSIPAEKIDDLLNEYNYLEGIGENFVSSIKGEKKDIKLMSTDQILSQKCHLKQLDVFEVQKVY